MLVSGQHKPPLATLCIQPRPPLPAPRFWRAGIVISFLSCGWLSPLLDLSLDSTSSSRIIQFSDSRSVSLTPWLPQNFISPLRTDCWGRGTIRLYVLDVNNSLYFLYHLCIKLWLLRLWAGETFSLSLFLLFLEAYSTVDACALGACVHVCVSLRPHGL